MTDEKLVSIMFRQALHGIMEKAQPDWTGMIGKMDNHIQILDSEITEAAAKERPKKNRPAKDLTGIQNKIDKFNEDFHNSLSNTQQQIQDDMDTLRFDKAYLETSLDKVSTELQKSETALSEERALRRGLERRLNNIEERIRAAMGEGK